MASRFHKNKNARRRMNFNHVQTHGLLLGRHISWPDAAGGWKRVGGPRALDPATRRIPGIFCLERPWRVFRRPARFGRSVMDPLAFFSSRPSPSISAGVTGSRRRSPRAQTNGAGVWRDAGLGPTKAAAGSLPKHVAARIISDFSSAAVPVSFLPRCTPGTPWRLIHCRSAKR